MLKNLFKSKKIVIIIIVAFFVISAGIFAIIKFTPKLFLMRKNALAPDEAVKVALDYLNGSILKEKAVAKLIGGIEDKSGLYKFKISVGGKEYSSYVTKDGKILFPQGIDIKSKTAISANGSAKTGGKTCQSLKKSDKPVLQAFVVSRCPYGLQMQRILAGIVEFIPSLAGNIDIKYIGSVENGKITSMHGDEEAKENLRQICVREEQPSKYFPYLSCHIKKGNVENCLKSANVNETDLQECETDKKRGLAYAEKDFALQNKYGVSGSPTLILNGEKVNEFDFGGRTAQAVEKLLCCGFTKEPSGCSKELESSQAATGFSENYSQGKSEAGGASCE